MTAPFEIFEGKRVPAGSGPAEPPDSEGVLETVAIAAGKPRYFAAHLARFARGCEHFALTSAPEESVLRAAAAELLAAHKLEAGVLRWSAWRSSFDGEGWRMRVGPPRPDSLKPSWRAAISTSRLAPPGPDRPFKHTGRRSWLEALAGNQAKDVEEVIFCDTRGIVVEGIRSNIFGVFKGRVVTPALAVGPLPGVARARILELAAGLGLKCEEREIPAKEWRKAGEIFATNALMGAMPISALDGRILAAPGPVTARIRAAWAADAG